MLEIGQRTNDDRRRGSQGRVGAIERTVGARVEGRAVMPLVRVPRLQQRSSAHLSP